MYPEHSPARAARVQTPPRSRCQGQELSQERPPVRVQAQTLAQQVAALLAAVGQDTGAGYGPPLAARLREQDRERGLGW